LFFFKGGGRGKKEVQPPRIPFKSRGAQGIGGNRAFAAVLKAKRVRLKISKF